MATNPFAQYAQPVAPQAQPVLASPVDPYKAADAQRADEQLNIARDAQDLRNTTASIQNQLTQLQIQDRIDKQKAAQLEREALATAQANLAEDAKHQMRNVIGAAKRARELSHNWFATGFGASKAAELGGTSATDVAAQLETIGSNTAFDRLQKMREASPTGGALGAVSERELTLLQSSIASLNQAQSDEQFRLAMDQVIDAYERVLSRIDPDYSSSSEEGEGITGSTTDDGLDIGSVSDDTPSPYDPGGGLNLNTIARGLSQGADSVVRGVAALPGMIINPVGQAIYDAAGYDQRYDVGNILSSALGLERNQSELGDAVIQGTASALTGGAAARAAGTIVNQAGTTGQVLNTLGRTPLRDAAAGAGAGAGMYAGNEVGGPVGGAIVALAGGAGGYATGNALASIASPVSRQLSQVGQAAQRQGVDLLPGDVGGPAVSSLSNAARQSYISASPMARAAQSQSDQLRGAAGNVARRDGIIADSQEAGEGIRAASERYISQTSRRGGVLYQRAQDAAGDTRISPPETIAKVDSYIARMSENPMASQSTIQELARFRDGLSQGVTIGGLRDARTGLREGMFDGRLRSGSEQGMWKDILNDLSTDIDAGLRQAGKTQAANQFKRADAFWRDRVEHIDEVLSPILGRDRGGEEIVAALEGMTRGSRGGNARLSRLLGNMEPQEAAQVRASVIDRLGRANPGAQNAEGDAFSAATFLTNWNKMTPQAKASLFGNSSQRRDLNEIAKLAEVVKQNASLANHSNTAGNLAANVGANVALFLTHPAAAVLGAVAQFGAGRLLSSPKFARWLASAPKNSSEVAARKWSENLGVVAANEPIIANDIASVQQFLAEALSRSPGRLAAQEDERN